MLVRAFRGIQIPLLSAVCAAWGGTGDRPPARFHERVGVLAVSVVVRSETGDLHPEDLDALVDGQPVHILSVEKLLHHSNTVSATEDAVSATENAVHATGRAQEDPAQARPKSEVAVVITSHGCSRFCLTAATRFLEREAESLTALGPVRFVVARQSGPELLGRDITQPQALRELVRTKVSTLATRNDLVAERRWLTDQVYQVRGPMLRRRLPAPSSEVFRLVEAGLYDREVLSHIRMAAFFGRRAAVTFLVLISDGFDFDAYGIWDAFARKTEAEDLFPWEQRALKSLGEQFTAEKKERDSALQFARELAADGIVALPYFPGISGVFYPPWAASQSGVSVFREFMGPGYRQGRTASGTVMDPSSGLQLLARETGGALIPTKGSLATVDRSLASFYVLTYQVSGLMDGELHRLEVRCRNGAALWAPNFVRHGRDDAMAEAAVRALLRGEGGDFSFPVEVQLEDIRAEANEMLRGTLHIGVDVSPVRSLLAALGGASFQLVLGVDTGRGDVFLHRASFEVQPETEGGSFWVFQAPIRWPRGAKRLAVAIQERNTATLGAADLELSPLAP
ncbi:hypothetical protein [Thermogutta sp.]|uniref:hypothetical protein n=1 Tax=Thermogutta sp. TaxID=1962930 RepID=UPI0032201FEE